MSQGRVHEAARAGAAYASASRPGVPSSLDGKRSHRSRSSRSSRALAAPFGIGRGIHLGDTIIGTKGRVAFEAPAAETLLTAHRELEKLVLTGRQARIKETVAQPYGDLVHEGQQLDPVCRDIEALLLSSQERVTGDVQVLFRPGSASSRASVAAFADGRIERRVRRSSGRMDAGRCARLLEDGVATGHLPPARRRGRRREAAQDGRGMRSGGGRQDRLGHPGARPVARDAHRAARFLARKGWCWSSRS